VLGIRLPAALAALALVGAVMLLVYALGKSTVAAAGAGALLLLTPPFIEEARHGRLDLLVALFIVLALWSFWQACQGETFTRRRYFLLFGVLVGLAVLSKSVIAVFAPAGALIMTLLLQDFSWLREKFFWFAVVLGALVTLPWHLYEWALFGADFWRSYVGFNVLERYQSNVFGDPALQSDYLFHLTTFAPLLTWLFVMAAAATGASWHSLAQGERAALGALVGTAALMLLVFFSAQTRAFSYLVPAYPFAAAFVVLTAFYTLRVAVKKWW
jgi:4-amino-4-deoxy-L-arabinose transferase-like glycosyltransferase